VRYYLLLVRARGWIGVFQWKPSITLATGEEYGTATSDAGMTIAAVLSVIQEKVNNPSADDPFEHEIATVSGQS
jgi:hypothetical protein